MQNTTSKRSVKSEVILIKLLYLDYFNFTIYKNINKINHFYWILYLAKHIL